LGLVVTDPAPLLFFSHVLNWGELLPSRVSIYGGSGGAFGLGVTFGAGAVAVTTGGAVTEEEELSLVSEGCTVTGVLVTAGPASIDGISVTCSLGTIDGEGLTTVLLVEGCVVIAGDCCDGSTGDAGVVTSLLIFGASCGRG
jgi:hypothetical protein